MAGTFGRWRKTLRQTAVSLLQSRVRQTGRHGATCVHGILISDGGDRGGGGVVDWIDAQQEWEAKNVERQVKRAEDLAKEEKEREEAAAAARAKAEEEARVAWENAPIVLDEIQSLRSAIKADVQLHSILKLVNIDDIIDATLAIVAGCANGYNVEQLSTGLRNSVTAVKGLFAAIPQFISLFTEKPKQEIVAAATSLQECIKGLLAAVQVRHTATWQS